MTAMPPDRADIVALPPFIFLAGVAVGYALDFALPVALFPPAVRLWAGGAVIVASLAVMPFVLAQFRTHGTSFDGRKPTDAIIATGPYRYSRNPAYVASYVLQVGLALATDTVWLLATLPLVILITHYGVVVREEAYLERKFGDTYRTYKASVRRYL